MSRGSQQYVQIHRQKIDIDHRRQCQSVPVLADLLSLIFRSKANLAPLYQRSRVMSYSTKPSNSTPLIFPKVSERSGAKQSLGMIRFPAGGKPIENAADSLRTSPETRPQVISDISES